MIIKICAKCSDMFSVQLENDQGRVTAHADGYVPFWFPNPSVEHYGDYVMLDIEADTGRIVNWKKPTKKELEETFKS